VTDPVFLSPTRLATYLDCQRKYDHGYVTDVTAPDETLLYANQGRAYHETIEVVCDATDRDDPADVIHQRAMDAFADAWETHLDPDEYASDAHQSYQRAENRAGIEAFFHPDGGPGIRHARQSIATELWVESVHDDVGLHGYADNVLRTDDGFHVVDYKRSVRGVVTPYTAKYLERHLNGEAHQPKRVKNAFQTATYVEGLKASDCYEAGEPVSFSFYGLLHSTDAESTPDGYEVSASGRERETTAVYEEYHDTIWTLIETAHEGIREHAHEPDPFDVIREEACPDCDYRAMCADYLAGEVER
jgi:putative RecB family exonuclease